jgi:phage terminase Nu1 subunit (DNA packaging protein)
MTQTLNNLTVPIDVICKICDLTSARISQLCTAGIIPRQERGRYELVPVLSAYIKYLRERSVRSDSSGNPDDYSAQRTRLTKGRADLVEMEREQLSNQLIPAADVEQVLSNMVSTIRSRLLTIPTKTAPNVFAAESINECRDILKIEIHETLNELANVEVRTVNPIRPSDSIDDGDEGTENIHATTESDSKRLGRSKSKAES